MTSYAFRWHVAYWEQWKKALQTLRFTPLADRRKAISIDKVETLSQQQKDEDGQDVTPGKLDPAMDFDSLLRDDTHGLAQREPIAASKKPCARYCIEIRGPVHHAEADDLAHIESLLHGHAGRVHVIDRHDRSLLLQGTVDAVRDGLRTLNAKRIEFTIPALRTALG